MSYCGNIDDPKYREKVQFLSNVLENESAAIAVIELNNGNNLDLAPNGVESKLFDTIIKQFTDPKLNKIGEAYKQKIKVYSPEFTEWFGNWINRNNSSKVVDENGEPEIVNSENIIGLNIKSGNYFLNIKKPIIIDAQGLELDQVLSQYQNIPEENDGLIINNIGVENSIKYVISSPLQLKESSIPVKKQNKFTPLKQQFSGKLIFAQSGSGKSTIADNETVFDSDFILGSIIGVTSETAHFAIANLEPEAKNEVKRIYKEKVNELLSQGKTILTTTSAFMDDADIIIVHDSVENANKKTSASDRTGTNNFVDSEFQQLIIDKAGTLSNQKKVIRLEENQFLSDILLTDPGYKSPKRYKYFTTLTAAQNNFLKSFGIDINQLAEYDGNVPLFDALERVINAQSKEDITDGVGYAAAFLMQNTPQFRELVSLIRMSPGSVGRAFRKHENPKFQTSDKIYRQLDKQYYIREIGKQISDELRKFYGKKEIHTDTSILQKLWNLIEAFFEQLSPVNKQRIRIIQGYTKNVAEAIARGDMSMLRGANIKPGTTEIAEKVDIEQALKDHPYEREIIQKLSKYDNIALAGSAAIALEVNVLRPSENPLHDLDCAASGETRESLMQKLTTEFKNVEFIRNISDGDDNNTETFLILDRPFKIESDNISKKGTLIDLKTGEKLGEYVNSELVLRNGVKGKFLDFFTNSSASEYGINKYNLDGIKINVSNYKTAVKAKLQYGRNKDIWDYQRLIVNDQNKIFGENLEKPYSSINSHGNPGYSFDYDFLYAVDDYINEHEKVAYGYGAIKLDAKFILDKLAKNETYRPIYDLLIKRHQEGRPLLTRDLDFILVDNATFGIDGIDFNGRRAFYDNLSRKIYIDRNAFYKNGNMDSVLWHEIFHAMTIDRLQDPKQRRIFQHILKRYQEYTHDPRYEYSKDNPHVLEEFVANIWADPEQVKKMKQIPSDHSGWKKLKSLWDDFKKFLFNFFNGEDEVENSLFLEASYALDQLLNQDASYLESVNDIFYENLNDTQQDTKDIIALLNYQYNKEGLDQKHIQERIKAYLRGDEYEVKIAKKMLDWVSLRRAQLHQRQADYCKEQYKNGYFDWNTYLNGIDLRKDIDDSFDLTGFNKLENYIVDPAEIIVPKLYQTQLKLGNKDISEIDVNYFKKVNPYYNSKLKDSGQKVDLLVRTHTSNFNIVFQDSLVLPGLEVVTPKIENGWRIDAAGNRMYKIPEELKYEIYKDEFGSETIVINKDQQKLGQQLIGSTQNLVSLQLFGDNIDITDDWIKFTVNHNNIKTNNKALLKMIKNIPQSNKEERLKALNKIYQEQGKYYKNDLANTLYNSFVRTLYMMSVRIPTQALQSIMAAKVVGLTNDEKNNVFVNRWQFWLQGSDLDIDKSYLMGVDLSSTGFYNHWSPIADYTSEEAAKISDEIPLPTGKMLVTKQEYYKAEDPILINLVNQNTIENQLIQDYLNNENAKKEDKLRTILELVKIINKQNELNITPESYQDVRTKILISLINKHNLHQITEEESRNIIQRNIMKVSLDERNMKPSYSPVDVAMDKFKDELKKKEDPKALERNLDDGGLSIARSQHDNSVGRKDVGIMANGLKAFFALTHYLNKYRKDPNFINSNRYFLSRLRINGEDKYFSAISDIEFEEEAIKALNTAMQIFVQDSVEDLSFANDDASQLLSSLTSLAADNAKELALAKMNASMDLACMHLFLVAMGYDAKEIVEYTKGRVFSDLNKLLNNSKLIGNDLNVNDALSVLIYAYYNDKNTESEEEQQQLQEEARQLKYLYSCAQELTAIARIAKINQGTKVDDVEANSFLQSLQDTINTQLKQVFETKIGSNKNVNKVVQFQNDQFIVLGWDGFFHLTHNLNPTQELVDKYIDKLNSINERNQQYQYFKCEHPGSIEDLSIDMYRYYTDEKYKEFVTDLYDFFKCNFNVLDCINNLAHFDKMLKAFVLSQKTIKEYSSRARVILNQAKPAYNSHRITTWKKVTTEIGDDTKTVSKTIINFKPFSDGVIKKANRFYDDYILSEWITEYGNKFNIGFVDEKGKKVVISPTTNENIKDFCNWMAYDLIPELKDKFPDNTFLKYIIPDFKKLRKNQKQPFLPKYKFNFDTDNLNSVQDQNKSFYINKGFAELAKIKLSDLEIGIEEGKDLTLGELFYLYDKLVTNQSYGSLEKAFDLYLSEVMQEKQNTIAYQLAKITQEHDLKERPEVIIDPVSFLAYCYQNEINVNNDGVMLYDYNKEIKESKEFDITGKYLFNLKNNEQQEDNYVLSEGFISALRSGQLRLEQDSGWTRIKSGKETIAQLSKNIDNLSDLVLALQQDDIQLKLIKKFILEQQKNKKQNPVLKSHQTLQVYQKFAERMAQLGVEVDIQKLPNNVNGKVENGKIILNANKDITTTPIHELMHLVFGYMKNKDFNNFEKLINMLYKSDYIQNIHRQLLSSSDYSSLMDLDQKEEAFCRALEDLTNHKITTDQLFKIGDQNGYDTFNQIMSPYISEVFGVSRQSELLTFLSDSISMLPTYQSTLFLKQSNDSTGYLNSKTKIIESHKISNYIQNMIKTNLLTQTEC